MAIAQKRPDIETMIFERIITAFLKLTKIVGGADFLNNEKYCF